MNKDIFNGLKIDRQVEYINSELSKGKSLTNITSEIGVARTTLRERFKKKDYVFNTIYNRYVIDYETKSEENIRLYEEIKVDSKNNLIINCNNKLN